jgi:hypothetical protein
MQIWNTCGTPLAWFTDYLSNRQQYVKIGNTESGLLTLTCGVPQGSTLGLLLFISYINDMPVQKNSHFEYLRMTPMYFILVIALMILKK